MDRASRVLVVESAAADQVPGQIAPSPVPMPMEIAAPVGDAVLLRSKASSTLMRSASTGMSTGMALGICTHV
jgi:hypothetical protein